MQNCVLLLLNIFETDVLPGLLRHALRRRHANRHELVRCESAGFVEEAYVHLDTTASTWEQGQISIALGVCCKVS